MEFFFTIEGGFAGVCVSNDFFRSESGNEVNMIYLPPNWHIGSAIKSSAVLSCFYLDLVEALYENEWKIMSFWVKNNFFENIYSFSVCSRWRGLLYHLLDGGWLLSRHEKNDEN